MRKILLSFVVFLISLPVLAQEKKPFLLEKSEVSAGWVKSSLRKTGPRLILTSESLAAIKKGLLTEGPVKDYYQLLYKNAVSLIGVPVLERKLEGRRLLGVSRDAVQRIGTLAIVYAVSGEQRFLDRVNAEIVQVCNFTDWNPAHFLDVGEMAYAVAIGYDWTLGSLPDSTKHLVKAALLLKAIQPSLDPKLNGWVKVNNNWNQVCHGGISAAAIVMADDDPELAAQLFSRALLHIPNALTAYAPNGSYPEGASYWAYGTSYTLINISAFESAFGTDFGISRSPGFKESAVFVKKLAGPSGLYFNYFDSGSTGDNSLENQELLSWFAGKTGNGIYFDQEKLKGIIARTAANSRGGSKMNGAALVWMAGLKMSTAQALPLNYNGDGVNPIVIFGSEKNDPSGFFLGAKGGAASLNHGNMDAGSFVFELQGVRWSVDLGMQNYFELENAIGVNGLWNSAQKSPRWTLLSKNNFGHSTLTVNDELHVANGFAPLTYFKGEGTRPEAGFDLSEVFRGQLAGARREFRRSGAQILEIRDVLELTGQTKMVTWAMMTQADIEVLADGALLRQNGKILRIKIQKPAAAQIGVIIENPPPLVYDMKVPGLKRLEFKFPAEVLTRSGSVIVVELGAKDR